MVNESTQPRINPHHSWLALEQAVAAEPDARKRLLLTRVRDHMEHEIKGELDALMATLTAEPIYHLWGNGEPIVIDGREAVHGFYENMIAGGGQQFEVVVERIVVDAGHVVTDGRVKQVYVAENLAAMGVPEVNGVPITEHELWLSDAQLVTLWPADPQGLLVGEDIYFGVNPMTTLVPIRREELPDYYQLPGV